MNAFYNVKQCNSKKLHCNFKFKFVRVKIFALFYKTLKKYVDDVSAL